MLFNWYAFFLSVFLSDVNLPVWIQVISLKNALWNPFEKYLLEYSLSKKVNSLSKFPSFKIVSTKHSDGLKL